MGRWSLLEGERLFSSNPSTDVGANTASILASLGVAAATVGFPAREALSNMISGLFISWDHPS